MADKPDDWLTLLLECAAEDGTPLTAKQVRDEALNMFMPGHETRATAPGQERVEGALQAFDGPPVAQVRRRGPFDPAPFTKGGPVPGGVAHGVVSVAELAYAP
ncbi:hypothetical protein ABZ934_24370 [Streptomyces sp. NPDC046557]|uniref:hypothetical protein n=1 Tax=Streptomyces sp. NPDC046557 TaxID=3155372 RepID=UPI0033C61388